VDGPGMSKHIWFAVTIVSGLVLARSAHADTIDELGEKVIKIIEYIASDVDANKPDCDKIGTALTAHMDDDAAVMAKVKADDAKKTKEQKAEDGKKMDAKYGDRMKAAMSKMGPLKSCKANAKVTAYQKKVLS
jgi:hypothetical protein